MNPDRLAALEEERDFLLRSLRDLDREHDAGDVDDEDFATLRDDYTRRAATVLRSIEGGRAALPPKRRMPRSQLLAGLFLGFATVALLAGLLLRSTSDRAAGDTMTGDAPGAATAPTPAPGSVEALLAQARTLQTSDPLQAIKTYDEVIVKDPKNAEALTYRGWTAAFVAMQMGEGTSRDVLIGSASEFLDAARAADPEYPDAQCFTAIVRFRFQNDAAGAKGPYDKCKASGTLPPSVAGLVGSLGSKIDEALAASGGSVPPTT